MKIEILRAGQKFRSYKHLCESLDMPYKVNKKSKEKQLQELGRFCKFHTESGFPFYIDEVYDVPLPKLEDEKEKKKKQELRERMLWLLDMNWDYDKNVLSLNDSLDCPFEEIWCKCNKCKNEWEMQIGAIIYGNAGCPICEGSGGEKKVILFLQKHKIKFIPQYIFEDLKGIGNGYLRFDFAILDDNGFLKCLIEYDGKGHFQPVNDFESFKKLREHDHRKNEYCKTHDIHLIRIPFILFNMIDTILSNKFDIDDYKNVLLQMDKKEIIQYYERQLNNLFDNLYSLKL